MKNGIVVADAGPIISLALVDKLDLLDKIFDEVAIANAVWEEVTGDESKKFVKRIKKYFINKIHRIESFNELTFVMDYGESESLFPSQSPNQPQPKFVSISAEFVVGRNV
jgi:predicted nucleic acid-binding protein